MPFTQWENPYFTVDPPEQGDTFAIYQLKGGPETRDYRYEAYESLQEAGLAVDRQNYNLVYTAPAGWQNHAGGHLPYIQP